MCECVYVCVCRLVIKEGPIDADELGKALRVARSLRVLVFDGAQLTRSAAEQVARAVAGKAELRLLYMARISISQAGQSCMCVCVSVMGRCVCVYL